MARAATTTDAFNAVAEPRRREILDALAGGELAVGDLTELLGLAQPQVSKHLRVLREVGLVDVRDDGRRRLYRVNAAPLRAVHAWVGQYERLWNERFDLIDGVLDELAGTDEPRSTEPGSTETGRGD
ncbi:ArsR/SmtB family transcription factor [Promicromonospora iranensis]|uniref:DNA-binding transcriptional ArsR family regulator n=1 Tax=Promicromonospora iranensis TaxID=1105144 RepID=A0ABU2CI44_9MICO|nr:metalloregulator ArsR/SmtB family transcription factor [Promicromonospora iranensis]MDR7381011.1 DNA-binding transcriptional ArsR family regulator [Promicromonospora iranensis]